MSHSDQDIIDMIKLLNTDPPINKRHRDQLRQQTLDAYDKRTVCVPQTRPTPILQFKGTTVMKIAASIAAVVALGILTNSMLNSNRALAFEDIARAILKVDNASFEVTVVTQELEEDSETSVKAKCIAQLPGQLRVEYPDEVIIADFAADKALFLVPKDKAAKLLEGFSELKIIEQPAVFLRQMQQHLRRAAKNNTFGEIKYAKLGEKQFNGRSAIGYRIHDPKVLEFYEYVDIWADAETVLPIRVEYTLDNEATKVTLENFKYNQKLDPKLFSLEPPAGYQQMITDIWGILGPEALPTLEDLVQALRVYADQTDGHFPLTLDTAEMVLTLSEARVKANPGKTPFNDGVGENTDPEMSQTVEDLLLSTIFTEILKQRGIDYTYVGGVKLGDKDRPIFWYKPKGSETFRVVYGDLSIREAKQAPAKP